MRVHVLLLSLQSKYFHADVFNFQNRTYFMKQKLTK